jgi:hypothetical protein
MSVISLLPRRQREEERSDDVQGRHSGMVRQHQTSGVQLHPGESRDSGFDAAHRPGMTGNELRRYARNDRLNPIQWRPNLMRIDCAYLPKRTTNK